MSIVTKEIKILLLVLLIAVLLAWRYLGSEVLQYMGRPRIWPLVK
jgi:hypothetical protein